MVRCHTNLLPMNSHWQQDYAQGKPLWVEPCPLNRSYPSRLDFLMITVGALHSAPIFWAKGGVRQSSGLTHCPQLSFRPGDSKLIGCGTLAKALRTSGSPASGPHPPPPSYLA